MAIVTGFTAERMEEMEAATIVNGEIVDGELILTRHDGTPINAGSVLILTSPNSTQYQIVVSNAGVLSTVAV